MDIEKLPGAYNPYEAEQKPERRGERLDFENLIHKINREFGSLTGCAEARGRVAQLESRARLRGEKVGEEHLEKLRMAEAHARIARTDLEKRAQELEKTESIDLSEAVYWEDAIASAYAIATSTRLLPEDRPLQESLRRNLHRLFQSHEEWLTAFGEGQVPASKQFLHRNWFASALSQRLFCARGLSLIAELRFASGEKEAGKKTFAHIEAHTRALLKATDSTHGLRSAWPVLETLAVHGSEDTRKQIAEFIVKGLVKSRGESHAGTDVALQNLCRDSIIGILERRLPVADGKGVHAAIREDSVLQDTLGAFFERCGLRYGDLMHAWPEGGYFADAPRNIMENMEQLAYLERRNPGVPRDLRNEFGIRNFARYPAELLQIQHREKDNTEIPFGVVLQSLADYSGAFYYRADALRSLITPDVRKGEVAVRVVEAGSPAEILSRLRRLEKMYGKGKSSFGMLSAHSRESFIEMAGPKDRRGTLTIEDLTDTSERGRELQGRVRDFFVPHPSFLVTCCNSGKEGAIAQRLSECLDAEVTAPGVPAALRMARLFKEDGRFKITGDFERYSKKYAGDLSATYSSGKRKEPKK